MAGGRLEVVEEVKQSRDRVNHVSQSAMFRNLDPLGGQ
jgi:hypothetical protein